MGVRTFGKQPDSGGIIEGNNSGDAESKPSILDLGSVATGNEHAFDSAATGDADDASSDVDSIVDPTTLSGDSSAPYGRTKSGRVRNRPVGSSPRSGSSGNTTRKSATEVSAFVGDILYSVHDIASHLLKVEELGLSEDEAKMLGEGIVRVSEQYEVPIPDAKVMAWINLSKILGQVYLPKIAASKIRKSRAKSAQRHGPVQVPHIIVPNAANA